MNTPWMYSIEDVQGRVRYIIWDTTGGLVALATTERQAELIVHAVNTVPQLHVNQIMEREPGEVRHTLCKECGLEIEGIQPFRYGQWRDRGNNTTCASGPKIGICHVPIKD